MGLHKKDQLEIENQFYRLPTKKDRETKMNAEYLTATYNVNSAPLVSLVDLMNAHDNTAELPLMREWTTKLDKLRNQNSKETFPFLAEIFDNDIPTA